MATRKRFSFERLGERLGELAVDAGRKAWETMRDFTGEEIAQLLSRPANGLCIVCGQEPQEPEGNALGANCKARAKAAGYGALAGIGQNVKSLTLGDYIEIARAAKDAGIWGSEEDGEEEPQGRPR